MHHASTTIATIYDKLHHPPRPPIYTLDPDPANRTASIRPWANSIPFSTATNSYRQSPTPNRSARPSTTKARLSRPNNTLRRFSISHHARKATRT